MNGSKSLATLWLVFLLSFGPSMAAARCRPGSMGCRYNIGRSEIPTTVVIEFKKSYHSIILM